ncbi:MAG TPA: TadE/TadG family type IV pilus assembly protein [Xanthobacteraceae bacterium]|nr:TadE/TadG family type IV pilus assembly protein [Xanthobacteraceae bacterium]
MIAILHSFKRRFSDQIARFNAERRGVAALEFAILLPLMLTLYLGGSDLSTGVSTQRKVNLTASALADLASQFTNIHNADMTNILNAASDIIAPYPANYLAATVSELAIDANGNATVVWSDAINGPARPVGQTVTIPSTLATPNSYLILGEAAYNFNPTYSYALTGTMSLSDQIYMAPRQSNSVTRINS